VLKGRPHFVMNIKLGTLNIIFAKDYPQLLADPVAKVLLTLPVNQEIGVAEINPNLSDTTAFCAHYQIALNQAANCVILEAKRADRTYFAACVILGTTRTDVNGLAKRTLDARKISFASMEKAVSLSAMEYGAITPIGLPESWPILIDKAVADSEQVIIGSGLRNSKLAISGKILASLPNTQVLEGLGK
jgi:prolyl-tRNA editing enzyme YbaK/EbsC (Cys-tRNA(Pro) deacylase)